MWLETVSKKIIHTLDSFSMLKKNDKVLVGFSGGKDSVVLLYMLNKLADRYGITVTALHVNHNIRGNDAKKDEEFCRKFCNDNNIGFICKQVYAVDYSKENKIGLEEGARILRYSAFDEVAKEHSFTKIATAHSSSDNMETVLFNISRGSTAEGIRGIPPVRDNIIRPLIYCSTDEILALADELKLSYVTDATNFDTDYTRNKIRHEIVPLLKQLNPKAENAFSNLSDLVRQDVEYINDGVKKINYSSPQELIKLHPSLLGRWLVMEYKKENNDAQLSNVHVNAMVDLIKDYATNNCRDRKTLSLPNKIDFVCTYESVYFKKSCEKAAIGEHKIGYGLTELDETGCAIYVSDGEISNVCTTFKNVYKKYIHTVLKKDVLTDTIFIRKRNDGDVFKFSNMTKKVKKMLNEAKIPAEERDILPMFCDDKGIMWIPGFRARDDVLPSGDDLSVHVYYLQGERFIK